MHIDWTIPLNAFLVLLTGVYVVLTYRLVQETRVANRLAQETFRQQTALSILPHIFCSASRSEKNVTLTIYNPASVPASDMEIVTLGLISEDEITVKKFLRLYLREKKNHHLEANEDGFFAVYDHPIFYYFPQRRRVEIDLPYPVQIDQLLIFIQFRDLIVTNYHRYFWFYDDNPSQDESRYRAGAVEPKELLPSPRLDISFSLEERKMHMVDGSPLPSYLADELLPAFKAGISSGFLKTGWNGVEDPGEWYEI